MADLTPARTEVIQFLFEQRMALFNVRRDHEWKIIFGVIGLIAAADAALITKEIHLSVCALVSWRGLLVILSVGSIAYQFGVQTRNRVDRIVMDGLYEILCDSVGIRHRDEIRLPIDASAQSQLGLGVRPIIHYTYLWAFIWQSTVMIVVGAISWFLPEFIPQSPSLVVIMIRAGGGWV